MALHALSQAARHLPGRPHAPALRAGSRVTRGLPGSGFREAMSDIARAQTPEVPLLPSITLSAQLRRPGQRGCRSGDVPIPRLSRRTRLGQGRNGKPYNIWIPADDSATEKLVTFAAWTDREGAAVDVVRRTVGEQGKPAPQLCRRCRPTSTLSMRAKWRTMSRWTNACACPWWCVRMRPTQLLKLPENPTSQDHRRSPF